jgi:hypothetical protein
MKQWINAERTVLVIERPDGTITVATRTRDRRSLGPADSRRARPDHRATAACR